MLDTAPYEGVPTHLDAPLRTWLRQFLDPQLERRIAVRMRIAVQRSPLREALDAAGGHRGDLVDQLRTGEQLLTAVDLALRLDDALDWELRHCGIEPVPAELPPVIPAGFDWNTVPTQHAGERARAADRLHRLLTEAGSAYQVDWRLPPTLTRRVGPAVVDAFEHTLATAIPPAAVLLRDAWQQVYGLDPDPTASYGNAVRAVEEVLCPLVLPRDPLRTLGKAIGELRNTADRWSFVLTSKDGIGDIAPLLVVVARLWEGQHARHGGGPAGYQPQTHNEAEAALHLATTVVQWVSRGALTRRAAS